MTSPRVELGRVIAMLLRRGWSPPPMSTDQADRLLEDIARIGRNQSLLLTDRERVVLARAAYGDTVAEIAVRFGRSPETVKRQQTSIRDKLGARSTANAVAIALDQGIIHSASGWREAA